MKQGFLVDKLSFREVVLHGEEMFHRLRWEHGIVYCPYCGEVHKIYQCRDGSYRYKCGKCGHRFSDRTKTLLHGSKLSTSVWMEAIYEVFTGNFISSVGLAVKLHINQKSAWLLLAKIRFGLEQGDYLLEGVVAQDEMYVGGSLGNYHYGRKIALLRSRHFILPTETKYDKTAILALNAELKQPVFGLNDGKRIVLYATPNPIKKEYVRSIVKKHVLKDSVSVSDESKLYEGWKQATGLDIHTNNHHNYHYISDDGYSSNAIENTFSWFKRGFGGRITHCKYIQLYLNEYVYRYNTRDMKHVDRFNVVVKSTIGKHVTYKQIKQYNYFNQFNIVKKNKLTESEINDILSWGFVSSIEQDHKRYQ